MSAEVGVGVGVGRIVVGAVAVQVGRACTLVGEEFGAGVVVVCRSSVVLVVPGRVAVAGNLVGRVFVVSVVGMMAWAAVVAEASAVDIPVGSVLRPDSDVLWRRLWLSVGRLIS